MPAKQRVVVQPPSRRAAAPSNYFTATYRALTSEENFSAVASIAMFGVAVGFFASDFSEILLPAF